jgi:hypothetical protein
LQTQSQETFNTTTGNIYNLNQMQCMNTPSFKNTHTAGSSASPEHNYGCKAAPQQVRIREARTVPALL